MERIGSSNFHLDAFDAVKNPRLTDVLGIPATQSDVDFAIPRLKADLPFAVDPFLLWKSDKTHYRELHAILLRYLQHIRGQTLSGHEDVALRDLLGCAEPRMAGLGYAIGSKAGSTIGPALARDITSVFRDVPQLAESGLTHLEVLGLVVPRLAEDRISDIAIAVLLEFFVSFTVERANALAVPMRRFQLPARWDVDRAIWSPVSTELPFNPYDESPLLFIPLDLLRHLPWINYEGYYKSPFASLVLPTEASRRRLSKPEVLVRNRQRFVAVERYVEDRESAAAACEPVPLFQPTPLPRLRQHVDELASLKTGKDDGVAQRYERIVTDILRTVLHPALEFAEAQSATARRVSIRDLVFFNPATTPFTLDWRDKHQARLVPVEMKNVSRLDGDHVDQISRYLDRFTGQLGIICSRRVPPPAVLKNVVDLFSSKRDVVLWLCDDDLVAMVDTYAAGAAAMDVLRSRYAEFLRLLPK